jgi:hypothetical protein
VSRGVVPLDSTLEAMLLEQGLQTEVVHNVIDTVKTVFDPRRLRFLQPFSLEQSLDGALRLFEYEIDATSFLRVRSANGNGEGLLPQARKSCLSRQDEWSRSHRMRRTAE